MHAMKMHCTDVSSLDVLCSVTRCKKLNYCSQTTPSITEQFDNADQSLFRTVLTRDNHVMHRLLPPNKILQYKLRPCNHNLTFTCKSLYYDSCNFIARMLFSEAY